MYSCVVYMRVNIYNSIYVCVNMLQCKIDVKLRRNDTGTEYTENLHFKNFKMNTVIVTECSYEVI